MNDSGQIYFDDEDKIPDEDRRRLVEAQRAEIAARLEEKAETMKEIAERVRRGESINADL